MTKRKLAEKHGFRSHYEMEVSKELSKAKVNWLYEPVEKSLTYNIVKKSKAVTCTKCGHNEYTQVHNYLVDFYLPKHDIYIEAKGYFRGGATDRKKYEAIHKQGVKLVMLFQSPNLKIRKGSKTTYASWAESKGIPWFSLKDSEWISKLKSL